MLPRGISLLDFQICFTLLKNYKSPIINAVVAIKAIVSVKKIPEELSVYPFQMSILIL